MKTQSKTVLIVVLAVLVAAVAAVLLLMELGVVQTQQNLIITEVVSSNNSSLHDEAYGSPDWIELYNPTNTSISLAGYGIGRTDDKGELYFFEEGTIGPGEYLTVYCCAPVDGAQGLCTGFNLPKRGTTLRLLSPSGRTIQTLEVPALETDVSYGLSAEGGFAYFASSTPGKPNDTTAYATLEEVQSGSTAGLVISEVLPYADDDQTYLEIYNSSDQPIQLSRVYATDDRSDTRKCALPDLVLQPGEYTVVYFEESGTEGALSFSINRTEDSVALFDAGGNEIDSLSWDVELFAGYSVGRTETGDVRYFTRPTPGAANDDSAAMETFALTEGVSALRITEVLRENTYSLIDRFGSRSPWVELYNDSQVTVNLSDYALSDRADDPFKWQLPDATLAPGEYLVIYLSGMDSVEEGEYHTSFKLGSSDSVLTLSCRKEGVVQTVAINKESRDNVSYGVGSDGGWLYFAQPTPGAANTTAGFAELSAVAAGSSTVWISEVSATHRYGDKTGDWVELTNETEETVSIDGWRLSSSPAEEGVTLSGSIAPGAQLVVKNDISVSAAGDTLYLYDAYGTLTDVFETGALRAGVTAGRSQSGQSRVLYTSATPGEANSASTAAGYCAAPVYSHSGGYVTEAFQLTLSTATPGAQIYYTTDGSSPTTSSTLYEGPILVDDSMTVRAAAFCDGMLQSDSVAATYLFEEPHSLKVICISIDEDDLSYVSASENRRDKRERECYIEIYEPDGTLGTAFPAGLRIGGNSTRLYPQRTFSVYLRGGYGRSSFVYPLFDGLDKQEFTSFTLRNFGQDASRTLLRDAFGCTAVQGMNIDSAYSTFAVAYINGEYWGLYELKENQNEDYFEQKYGVDKDVVQGVRSNTYVYNGNGNNLNIKALFALARRDTADDEIFAEYISKADQDMFIDYLCAQFFFANGDVYNQKYIGSTDGSLKWRPVFYDLDMLFSSNSPSGNVMGTYFRSEVVPVGVNGNVVDMGLYYGFYKNESWRERFVERYAEVLNTVLTNERLLDLFDEMTAMVDSELDRHIERWGRPSSRSKWESEVASLRSCIERRREYAKSNLQRYFSLSDERMAELFPNG